jgi:Amt family ammonium transporter
VQVRVAVKLDDSLDVVGVHGIGGIWGALATGLFANSEVSGIDFANGLFHGNAQQMWDQSVGIVAIALFSFIVTYLILKVLDMTMGVRVTEDEEELGLDVTQHGERAYHSEEGGMPSGAILPAPPATYTD